jgi:hypothetical protein
MESMLIKTEVITSVEYDKPSTIECRHLVLPYERSEEYRSRVYQCACIPLDRTRAIMLPDGAFGEDEHIVVHEGGKKVTIEMKESENSAGTTIQGVILLVRAMLDTQMNMHVTAREKKRMERALSNMEMASMELELNRLEKGHNATPNYRL